MSELLKTFPKKTEYVGEKKELGKEALQKTINEVKNMDANQTKERLSQYKNTKPGLNSKDNTFEMMALYQRAIQLLSPKSELTIDARFGTKTYGALMKTQKDTLQFTGKDGKIADGLPGPTTTSAIIKALEKLEPREEIIEDTPLQKAKKYLTETERYIENKDGFFKSPTGDFIIKINNGNASGYELNGKIKTLLTPIEARILAELDKHLAEADKHIQKK